MEREKLIPLVTKAQQGDAEAMNDLFQAFYNDVYYFALKTVKDEQTACDVTQETFIEIINTLDNLQEPAAFVKWMKQITYHQCTRYFKKKKDVLADEDEDGNTVFDTLQEEKADFIPDEALDQAEFKKTIMAMLDELSEEQRAAVMLYYFDELSVKQIAEIQNVSENTVKSRLNYARKSIKKSVEDYEERNGVKLHSVAILPLLLWLFRDYFSQPIPASAKTVAQGVTAATGTTVTATTTAAGMGAKMALPIAAKIIAGVAAAVIVIGGVSAAFTVSNRDDSPANSSAPTGQTGGAGQGSETPTEARYYDPSRVSDTHASMDDVVEATKRIVPNYTGWTAPDERGTIQAIYSKEYELSCISDLDPFRYNITAQELRDYGWGDVKIDTLSESGEPTNDPRQILLWLDLPFESRDDAVAAAKRDTEIFLELIGGEATSIMIGNEMDEWDWEHSREQIADAAEKGEALSLEDYWLTTPGGEDLFWAYYGFTIEEKDGAWHYRLNFSIVFDYELPD